MSKQKKPDQRPEVYRKYLEDDFGITVTPEKILGFVNTITRNLGSTYIPPSEEETKAAATFLLELISTLSDSSYFQVIE